MAAACKRENSAAAAAAEVPTVEGDPLDRGHSRRIAELVLKQFDALPSRGKPEPSEWTVLAGIVMDAPTAPAGAVVALATGTKCVGKVRLSAQGDIVADCHAEVLARRSLLRLGSPRSVGHVFRP